ncbi:putative caffeoyl-CoA O-methyltransferase [Sesamum alatum]|uniref:Caffeoyl-CoA O-methyltransferase n=1 Tax=Sesamum alatum TaxID=300844 RepID=A0AAE2CSJ7_9LAMI|nr:putative caffeoyl-CoA O-methyltransferase [Sesamum alatum]
MKEFVAQLMFVKSAMKDIAKTNNLTDKGCSSKTNRSHVCVTNNYLLETSVYPREPQSLKELRALSSNHPRAAMGTAPDAGQFMALILKLINAKKTIEIGVFTGYSLLLTALTIPDDGKENIPYKNVQFSQIIAIDVDKSAYEIGLPVIEKAGVKHKINFIDLRIEELLTLLSSMLIKSITQNYHERLLKLLKPGGVVIYDNTLWGGTVAMPEDWVPERRLETRSAAIEFNKYLAADARVQISQVPLGDGITMCRRL